MWLLGKNNRIETVKKKFLSRCERSFFFYTNISWTYQWKNIVYFLTKFGKNVDNTAFTMYVIDRMFNN